MAQFFDGREHSKLVLQQLESRVKKVLKSGLKPKLVSILIGNDPASNLFVNLKRKRGEEIGITVEIKKLHSKATEGEIIDLIEKLNKDDSVHGIMVQLPLPDKFSPSQTRSVLEKISPLKDVDGLGEKSPYTTPVVGAVLEILQVFSYRPSKGYEVVVVGATGFEGKKISSKLKSLGYKVRGANSKTKNLRKYTKNADILISATGVSGLISADDVGKGACVIDVGSPAGDVKADEVSKKVKFISAVPGGIGPVTISCLMRNLVESAESSLKRG